MSTSVPGASASAVSELTDSLLAPLSIPQEDLAKLRPALTAAVRALLEERPRLTDAGFERFDQALTV